MVNNLKKSDLKTGMIVRTEHDRFGFVELEQNIIDFCYEPNCPDNFKRLEKVSIDNLIEIDGVLGIGGYVTEELKEQLPDLFQEDEINAPFLWYRIVEVYQLDKIYDNGIGVYPGIIIE
jgi:hypothetical protein|nr:MAG TPA: AgrD [Caudoviricetes sp.]